MKGLLFVGGREGKVECTGLLLRVSCKGGEDDLKFSCVISFGFGRVGE